MQLNDIFNDINDQILQDFVIFCHDKRAQISYLFLWMTFVINEAGGMVDFVNNMKVLTMLMRI